MKSLKHIFKEKKKEKKKKKTNKISIQDNQITKFCLKIIRIDAISAC